MPKVAPKPLSVSPSSVQAGEAFTVSGGPECKEAVGADGLLYANAGNPGCCLAFAIRPNADGSFTYTGGPGTFVPTDRPGNYVFKIIGRKKGGSLYTFAQTTFPVA